jgi:shikimate kinase
MIIFLIGFMGSGKSTTGKRLAGRLGYSFLDTDSQIVKQFGMSVNDIFDRLGEKKFRESEVNLLNELVLRKNLVVSTGGGLPCHGDNMDVINRHGISVYLKVSPSALYRRLVTRKYKRPLIRDLTDTELQKFIEQKIEEREPFYSRAKYVVEGLNVDLDMLIRLLNI